MTPETREIPHRMVRAGVDGRWWVIEPTSDSDVIAADDYATRAQAVDAAGRHGWSDISHMITGTSLGDTKLPAGASVFVAPVVADQRRCICTEQGTEPQCQRQATQEDFLCDPCREGRH